MDDVSWPSMIVILALIAMFGWTLTQATQCQMQRQRNEHEREAACIREHIYCGGTIQQ